jgi:hypothetical protein
MAERVEFGAIDFQEIAYRNEYQHAQTATASLACLMLSLPSISSVMFKGGWWTLLGGYCLIAYALVAWSLFVKLKARVIVTGSGVTLRRPWLKEIEIPYSEIEEITFDDGWLGPGKLLTTLKLSAAQSRWEVNMQEESGRLVTLELSEPLTNWVQKYHTLPITSKARLTIRARGGRKIQLDQSLECFEALCRDLMERHQRALERYQGYAKGTSLRQPERYWASQAALREQETVRRLNSKGSHAHHERGDHEGIETR